jgi:hypothetical protein
MIEVFIGWMVAVETDHGDWAADLSAQRRADSKRIHQERLPVRAPPGSGSEKPCPTVITRHQRLPDPVSTWNR